MSAKIIFILCSSAITFGSLASTYDQRQTGDLNVQVDLKDLRIIALMKSGKEEYVDYDYAYDYSEMTIKPQNGTTPKPVNSTSTVHGAVSANNTSESAVVTEPTIVTIKNNHTDSSEAISQPMNRSSTTLNTLDIVTMAAGTDASSTDFSTSTSRPVTSNSTMCKKGLVLGQKGDCELKLQGAGNALLKLVKLSQKLKLRRENRGNRRQ